MTVCRRRRFAREERAAQEPGAEQARRMRLRQIRLQRPGRGQFRVKWIQYRGAGQAKIVPKESAVLGADGRPTLTEGKSTAKVTFDRPGTYTLRAYAMDGDAYFVTTTWP